MTKAMESSGGTATESELEDGVRNGGAGPELEHAKAVTHPLGGLRNEVVDLKIGEAEDALPLATDLGTATPGNHRATTAVLPLE